LAIAITAGLISTFFFCPRYQYWKGIVLTDGPLATDYGRAVVAIRQIDNPWIAVAEPMHKVIAWRLLFPIVWHYLRLPIWLFLTMPHIGCVLSLWLAAGLAQKRLNDWAYTWMTVALTAMLPWFFVSTGWLGYFDSWLALGMLTVSFVPSLGGLVCACLLTPWIDERFVLALPVCLIVRIIVFHGLNQVPLQRLIRDSIVVVIASLVYPTIRILALLRGDLLAANYVSNIWDEIQRVPWTNFLEGLWSGYRAAWAMILGGIYFWWRQSSWIWGIALFLIIAVSSIGSLFIAADMSRNAMIVLPSLLLGVWLWHKSQPQTFKWALPAVLMANLLLPAAHVMWNLRIPIYYLHAVRAFKTPSFLDPEVYTQMAKTNLEKGQLAEANTALETALKLDNRFVPAYVYRALMRMGKNDLPGATQDTQLALTLEPGSPDALFVKALIARRYNDISSAKTDVQNALQNAPPDWSQRSQAQGFLDELNKTGSQTPHL
jgi:hypothetical protein